MVIHSLLRKTACALVFALALLWGGLPAAWAQEGETPEGQATEQAEGDGAAAADEGGLSMDAAIIGQGKELFDGNCAQCHAVHEQVVGPALANVYERRDVPWLVNFIKYPEKTIASGDEYAVALYEKYKAAGYMPNHDALSDDQIKSILSYVKDETIKGPAVAATGGGTGGGGAAAADAGISNQALIIALSVLGGLMLIVLFALGMLVSVLAKYLKQQDNLTEEESAILGEKVFDLKGIFTSPGVVGLIGFLFFALVFKGVITGLFSIGVQQGYAPTQPIPFSHKLHAGYYEIDCKYCHTGAARGKSAGIPSANICMNCHNTIRNTAPNIQKIYKAIENDEPIQWVRVHNLPDLSYFNHSQHVTVAGIECETCHGEIGEMEVVQQVSLLTMGWCIACHRETPVNTKDNGYYDNMVKLHAEQSKEPLTVEDIGGLECARCHY